MRPAFIFGAWFVLAAAAVHAADAPPSLKPGEVIPSVVCSKSPDQSYALYLPSSYTPQKTWPIVYIFEPGARGPMPVELMKDAAEQYGYIIAASNNSHNGPLKPELEAAQAMANDTHARFSIDEKQVYFGGFSGGARLATTVARLCKCAAGVFLSGAGFSPDVPPSSHDENKFPVFAAVGTRDFNYGELVPLDTQLDTEGFPHYLRRFDGPHEWAPADVWPEAFAWSQLQAMQAGRRPRDVQFIAAELARFTERARAFDQSGDLYLAWHSYRQVSAAFHGLADTKALDDRVAILDKDPAVHRAQKQEKDGFATQFQMEQGVMRPVNELVAGLKDPSSDRRALREAAEQQIQEFLGGLKREKRPQQKLIYDRTRAGIFAFLVETAQSLLAQGKHNDAQVYAELAEEVRPDWPWAHITMAQCLALSGDKKDAMKALRRARMSGLNDEDLQDLMKRSHSLGPLQKEADFQKIVQEAPVGPAPVDQP